MKIQPNPPQVFAKSEQENTDWQSLLQEVVDNIVNGLGGVGAMIATLEHDTLR